jgi:hypothetical protein
MSLQTLANHFHLEKVSRAPARFDEHQLLHWQKEAVLSENKATIRTWLQEKLGTHTELESDLYKIFYFHQKLINGFEFYLHHS